VVSMTLLSFDLAAPVTPLSYDSVVIIDLKLKYFGEKIATVSRNFLGCESAAYGEMFDEKNQSSKIL
jgi:hypothetical protein